MFSGKLIEPDPKGLERFLGTPVGSSLVRALGSLFYLSSITRVSTLRGKELAIVIDHMKAEKCTII